MAEYDPEAQREYAVDLVRRLRAAGYIAYWAGGCVRDRLLGLRPKDYDVATSATPAQVRTALGRRRTIEIGAAFGVIGVIGPPGAGQVEVATFRRDVSYSDGRRPDEVVFSSPEEDAARRDFTINGMFYDPLTDQVLDYVGGQADLARRLIRAIGNPHERLAEDKLRMLRAVRFAATYDFALDDGTLQAIQAHAPQIQVVSAERVGQEMRRLLAATGRARGVELLAISGLLPEVLPELSAVQPPGEGVPAGDDWQATIAVLQQLGAANAELGLAALVHRCGANSAQAAAAAQAAAQRWRWSIKEQQHAEFLARRQRALDRAEELPWSRLQRLLIEPWINDLLALHAALARAEGRSEAPLAYCRQKLALPPEQLNPPPLVTGDDLLALGVPRGPQYQVLLTQVRDAQLDGTLSTKQEALDFVRGAAQQ